jgi:AcrR family transcriptional regulator
MPTTITGSATSDAILSAARDCLLESGFAALTTRKVAEGAGVPLSQIHYHFGSKSALVLQLLQAETARLLDRQGALFAREIPVSQRWAVACDYLDEDLQSGYVRVLQEMLAAGWSSEVIGGEVRAVLTGWIGVILDLVRDAESVGIRFGPLSTRDVAALVAAAFTGAEAMILLGMESDDMPLRGALRRIGSTLEAVEAGAA